MNPAELNFVNLASAVSVVSGKQFLVTMIHRGYYTADECRRVTLVCHLDIRPKGRYQDGGPMLLPGPYHLCVDPFDTFIHH